MSSSPLISFSGDSFGFIINNYTVISKMFYGLYEMILHTLNISRPTCSMLVLPYYIFKVVPKILSCGCHVQLTLNIS